MADHHKAHPEYAELGIFAGYGEFEDEELLNELSHKQQAVFLYGEDDPLAPALTSAEHQSPEVTRQTEPCGHPDCEFPSCDCEIPAVPRQNNIVADSPGSEAGALGASKEADAATGCAPVASASTLSDARQDGKEGAA